MKKIILGILIGISIIFNSINASADNPPTKSIKTSPVIKIGVLIGYNNGFGFGLQTQFSQFAQGFPMSIRFGAGMSFLDPGSAMQARAIFINNNTNGTPEEKGHFIDARLDFLYDLSNFNYIKPYIGVHYTSFKGNFVYVGGNEDFDVVTSSWGIGAGFDGYFPVTDKIDFTLTIGSGYYFPNTLKGYDTYYSPDDENVNPREDYTFNDADNAINQPKFELRSMAGFSFKL